MKRILLTASVLLMVSVHVAFGQQDPKFTHYMFNQVVYNPAFIGSEFGDQICVNLIHHDQWMGYDNNTANQDGSKAPLTTTFNVHKPFTIAKGKHKLGAGLIFANDGLGFQQSQFGSMGLSYHYDMGKDANGKDRWLIGGLNLGFVQSGIDGSKLIFIDQGDVLIDALIADGQSLAFDFGLGLLYKTNDYYIGISNMHIPQSDVDWFNGEYSDTKINRHFYINAGYDYELTPNLVLKPRALIKFDRAIWQADLAVLAEYGGQFWGGLNVRRGEGMMILAGFKAIDRPTRMPKYRQVLKIGLSYDITFNRLQNVSNNTLELMANYCFPIIITPRPPKPEQDVRFLGGYTL